MMDNADGMPRRAFLGALGALCAAHTSACERATSGGSTSPAASAGESTGSHEPQLFEEPKHDVITEAAPSPRTDEDAAARSAAQQPVEEAAASPVQPRKHIYLQPLGSELRVEEMDYIQDTLQRFFSIDVTTLPLRALPRAAYYPPRARYRAEKLLDDIEQHMPSDAHVVVGLTEVDISTTKGQYEDWGILGLATVSGGQCVISRFRAKRGAKDEQHTKERLAKVVVHEVGHTLGLDHCPNYGCLMEDGKGSVTTTDHEYDLCSGCRAQIADTVLASAPGQVPWPNPAQ